MALLRQLMANELKDNPSSTDDVLANYFGTSQTQQPQQQANAIPKTTTISTDENGDTTVTQKHTISNDQKQSAQQQVQPPQYVNLANSQGPMVAYAPPVPVAPQGSQPFQNATTAGNAPVQVPQLQQNAQQAPQYVQPQAPQGTFGRMVQQESGGQQYAPNGQILTSPKGAIGIAQVMPSTGAQPGYGIAPATPQELATPEGNLRFGQRYFEGMYNHFGQDPEKAAAAYNAGPGTIERAMLTADQKGGTWKDHIPQETKDYLTKVFPAGEQTHNKYAALIAGVPSSDVGMTPEEQAIHHIVLNSGDVNALGTGTYAGDHLIDKATKRAYADQHATLLERNQQEQKAEKEAQKIVANGGVGLQRALKEEGDEGSYLKAYLFQRLGLHDLAKNEQQKLGGGDMWAQTMVQGQPAWVKFNGQGAPVKGYNAAGELSGEQLLLTSGNLKNAEVGTQIYADPTTPTGGRYALRRINGRAEFVDTATGAVETNPNVINRLTPLGVAGTIAVGAERKYQEHGAGTQGQAGAEGYALSPLPTRPGSQVLNAPAPGNAPAVPNAVGGSQQNQIGGQGATVARPAIPTVAQPAPAVQAPAQPAVPIYQQKQQTAVSGKEQEAFIKDKTDFSNNATPGQEIANIRRGQIKNLVDDPQMIGYLVSDPTTSGTMGKFIREVAAGAYDHDEGKRLADDLRTSGLPIPLQNKIQEYQQANTRINALTLKANEGPGSISNIEQRMNQNANMTNIGDLGPWSALTGLSKQQLTGDMTVAKAQFMAQHPELNTAASFQKEWAKQQNSILKGYQGIYDARLAAVKPYYEAANDPKNGNNEQVQRQYRNASVAAFKTYPAPDFNPETGKWEYKTKESKMAAMRAIAGGQ